MQTFPYFIDAKFSTAGMLKYTHTPTLARRPPRLSQPAPKYHLLVGPGPPVWSSVTTSDSVNGGDVTLPLP